MIQRLVERKITQALADTPVVLITGARQSGKTTLVMHLIGKIPGGEFLSFDDASVFTAIKREVDRDRTPGRFILTGSANPLSMSKVADSLAGRMETITLRYCKKTYETWHKSKA